MRDSFESLGNLMGCYQAMKAKVQSTPTILPKKDSDRPAQFDATKQQGRKEELFCFIGDIEKFRAVYYYQQPGYAIIPQDCIDEIFLFCFCHSLSSFNSYGELAVHFRKKIKTGNRIPRKITNRGHLEDICSDMKEKAEIYFLSIGYLKQEEYEEAECR